ASLTRSASSSPRRRCISCGTFRSIDGGCSATKDGKHAFDHALTSGVEPVARLDGEHVEHVRIRHRGVNHAIDAAVGLAPLLLTIVSQLFTRDGEKGTRRGDMEAR